MAQILNEWWISTLIFDIIWHWKSEWDINNVIFSDVYNQWNEMINELFKKWIYNIITCGTSFSALPMLKLWNDVKEVNQIILRSPIINNYRQKKENELWIEKMKEWESNWTIETLEANQFRWAVSQPYNILADYDENFASILNENTKSLIIWAWTKDEEIDINYLNKLRNNNINILEYTEWHIFSIQSIEDFTYEILKIINNKNYE